MNRVHRARIDALCRERTHDSKIIIIIINNHISYRARIGNSRFAVGASRNGFSPSPLLHTTRVLVSGTLRSAGRSALGIPVRRHRCTRAGWILSSRSVGAPEKPSRAAHTQNNPYPPPSSSRPPVGTSAQRRRTPLSNSLSLFLSTALSTFFTPPSGMCAVTAATEYEVAAVSYNVYTLCFSGVRPTRVRQTSGLMRSAAKTQDTRPNRKSGVPELE